MPTIAKTAVSVLMLASAVVLSSAAEDTRGCFEEIASLSALLVALTRRFHEIRLLLLVGKKSEAMTSQFTRALMSVLDEGWTNCKISDIEKKLHLRFPIESEVQISQPGPGCSLRIPDVLRRPAMFRWYEFDKARFCSDYWDAATKTPFAMTGKESFMP